MAIRTSYVQTRLIKILTGSLSEKLNTSVSIKKVDFTFFNHLILDEFYLADQNGDTLLYADEIVANISRLSYSHKIINISKLTINDSKALIRKNDSGLNIDFLLNSFNGDTTNSEWDLTINELEMNDGCASYRYESPGVSQYGINYEDIFLNNLNFNIDNFGFGDTTTFNIKNLGLYEKSGAIINNLATNVRLSKNLIELDSLEIKLKETVFSSDYFEIRYDSINNLLDYYNIPFRTKINESTISFNDIAYFLPGVRDFDEAVSFAGTFSGKISDIRGKAVKISHNSTKFEGSLSLIGLPDIRNSFIYTDIVKFTTNKEDIENLKLPDRWISDPIELPGKLNEVGYIEYTGNLTGFINDFVAFGNFKSDYGIVSTDLGVKKKNKLDYEFRGDIRTQHFNPAETIGKNSLLKEINLNLSINGSYNKSGLSARVVGKVDSIDFNNYIYHNVDINGDLTDKKFDGLVTIIDPNLEVEFTGRFDFTNEIPIFNFTSVVSNARLNKLNLIPDENNPVLSFTMQTNFSGYDLDNLRGEVILWDTKYETDDNLILMDEFYLTANKEDSINSLQVSSSLADLSVKGNFKFSTLAASFINYLHNKLPSFYAQNEVKKEDNIFDFSLHIKDVNPVLKSFLPNVELLPDAKISGNFSDKTLELNADFNIPGASINSLTIDSFRGNINTIDGLLGITSKSKMVYYNKLEFLSNLKINANSFTDTLDVSVNWDNNEIIKYEGDLLSLITFKKSSGVYPEININLKPTELIIADTVWYLSSGIITNDSTYLSFSNFNFRNNTQQIFVDGEVSYREEDTLHIKVRDIPISNFSSIINISKYFHFDGNINGESSLTSAYTNPIFTSDIEITEFSINGQSVGDAKINSIWDDDEKKILINGYTTSGQTEPLNFKGYYIPENKKIDFDIKLDRLHASVFYTVLEGYVSDLNGIISDEIKLTGTSIDPVFNGKLKLQKISFLLNYLNTRYSFSNIITIKDNLITLNDLELYDNRGEKAIVNGTVFNDYFRNLIFDINLNATNLTFLNTKESDNSSYFGEAFATGIIDISGDLMNININIKARTEKNTRFFIPLYTETEIEDNSFISFVDKSEDKKETEEPEDIVSLSGIQLNFELEVTPVAEVQMIFNSKLGDIVKGYGSANLKMEINTQGEFNMYGDYIIDKGEYLFVLANLMSKKFKVKPGGVIRWNGDPYDAIIDIETYYPLNTSLQELFLDTSEAYTKTIPVECQIFMTDKLMNPDFKFAIDLPKSGDSEKAQLNNLPEDELNKQFISLLFINRFQPLLGLNVTGTSPTSGYSITESTSELLSNQLSHWLSQISDDFDLGFKYRNGDQVSKSQVEFALQTQLFNDRLTINGNVGVGGQYAYTDRIVGDVEADLKLNKSGKVRIKAFSKSNTNFDYDKGPTTQGVGMFYREEFDNFNDLLKKYFNKSKVK